MSLNRKGRREQKRAAPFPKQYTQADLKKKVRETAHLAAKYNLAQTLSCVLLVMHRKYGWSASQCLQLIEDVDVLALSGLTVQEFVKTVEEELGFNIIEEAEERLIL